MIYWVNFFIELYKITTKNLGWDYCYKNNIIYSYSDLLLYDLRALGFSRFFILILLIHIFYLILIFQLLLTIVFVLFPLKSSKGGMLFNVFIYTPFLYSKIFKKLYKMLFVSLYKNKEFYKILFLNFLHVYIWGFPRLCFNYAFISLKILISYELNPNFEGFYTWLEIIFTIYKETYEKLIEKLEIKL